MEIISVYIIGLRVKRNKCQGVDNGALDQHAFGASKLPLVLGCSSGRTVISRVL